MERVGGVESEVRTVSAEAPSKHVIEVTARRFKLFPWPQSTNIYEKVCTCDEANAEALKLLNLGANKVVVW